MTDGDMNLFDRELTIDVPDNPLAVSGNGGGKLDHGSGGIGPLRAE